MLFRSRVKAELPNGKGLSCFVDPLVMFSHINTLNPKNKKDTKDLNQDLTVTDILITEQCTSSIPTCSPYTGSKDDPYVPGQPIEAFKSSDVFYGVGAAAGKGKKESILTDAGKARNKVQALIKKQLHNSPTLRGLALELASRSESYHREFINHCDSEKSVLEALKMEVDDILLLFSELCQIIFEYWHSDRISVHDTSEIVDPVERITITHYLWSILKVHEKVEEFANGGFKHHNMVQSAFTRFLTRKTGENSSVAIGARLNKLDKESKASNERSVEAKREASLAKNQAKGAQDAVDNLIRKNDLKK